MTTLNDTTIINTTRDWLDRAVIGLNLCPFAKAVQVKNQIRYVVSHATQTESLLEDLLQELRLLQDTAPEQLDTTLLIVPAMFADFYDFNDFFDVADAVTLEPEFDEQFQVASFHPQFQFEGTAPDDIENYTNRSPYPILHLLRENSISRAVEAYPDAEMIYGKNIETLRQLGLTGWRSLFGPERQLPTTD